jgi:sigma-B regulation protein RsbU (phosphoserine phosphatase)
MADSSSLLRNLRWRRLDALERAAAIIGAAYGVVLLARLAGVKFPLGPVIGATFAVALGVLFVRWFYHKALYRLRVRLMVASVFIAVVPVFLLLLMAWYSTKLIYNQFAGNALSQDVQQFLQMLKVARGDLARLGRPQDAPRGDARWEELPRVSAILEALRRDLPNLAMAPPGTRELLLRETGGKDGELTGLAQTEDNVWLVSAEVRKTPSGANFVGLGAPVTPELLNRLVADLGPVQFEVTRPPQPGDPPDQVRELADSRFVSLRQIQTRQRTVRAPQHTLDFLVQGVAIFPAYSLRPEAGSEGARSALYAGVITRFSVVNERLLRASGVYGGVLLNQLILFGMVFLLLEGAALIIGINISRSITQAVDELSSATQAVQSGDFTQLVRVERRDQLGALAESFNTMTSSISTLIEEQKQRQRLENELTIAREVQAQLFPRGLPSLPGAEFAALCKAARVVSGDYYDFISLAPDKAAIILADISGKGISAALLMANLQAALRSQLLLGGLDLARPAELAARMNRHLLLNSADDRYATLFFALYDAGSRKLYYTNAGHLPPLYVTGNGVQKLDQGGTVIGLIEEATYDEAIIRVEPGSVFVAYSDGLTEPENVYGEQFGIRRFTEEVQRHRETSAARHAELLIAAAEEWAGTPEQADDMTVVVAKFL